MFDEMTLDDVSRLVAAIGAINWGLVDFAGINLVRMLFGRGTLLSRLIYALVAVAGAWSAYRFFTRVTRPAYRREGIRRFFQAIS